MGDSIADQCLGSDPIKDPTGQKPFPPQGGGDEIPLIGWFEGGDVFEIVVHCPPYQFTDWSIRLRCYFSKLGQDRLRKEYLQFLHGSRDNMDTDAGSTWVVA